MVTKKIVIIILSYRFAIDKAVAVDNFPRKNIIFHYLIITLFFFYTTSYLTMFQFKHFFTLLNIAALKAFMFLFKHLFYFGNNGSTISINVQLYHKVKVVGLGKL
jgi:hypothetical protein